VGQAGSLPADWQSAARRQAAFCGPEEKVLLIDKTIRDQTRIQREEKLKMRSPACA
jgi:hypothetical protein